MESMRLSPQLVGFSVANDGGMRVRLCGEKKKIRSRSACFNPRRPSLPPRSKNEAGVCLGSKCSTVSRCGQSTTCKDDARSPGAFVHGSMRHIHQTQVTSKCRHGPHTHTHTRSHTRTDTHICHMHSRTQSR